MTVGESLANIDEIKPNQVSREKKIEWLEKIEERIQEEIVKTHIGVEQIEDPWYEKESVDEMAELYVKSPYDEVYRWWLAIQIDLVNQEYDKYNAELALFNQAFLDYASYINRNYMHTQTKHRGY